MKSILFVTIHLPYPPNKGASVFNTFKLVEYLNRQYTLFVASLLKEDDAEHADDFVQHFSISQFALQPIDVPRSVANLAKSYLQNISLNVYRSRSVALRDEIAAVADQYDVIFIDHYEAFQYVPQTYRGRVILRIHNAEFMMWRRFARLQKNPLKKLVTLLESYRIRRLERKYSRRADVVLGPAEDNMHIEPRASVRAEKFVSFPFLGDESQLELPLPDFEQVGHNIIYVGTLTWEPNVDGLLWFISECWATVRAKFPDVKLSIIGKNPDPRLTEAVAQSQGIELTGFVEDLEPYFLQSKVNIVPLRFGSGIKVKVINGLYRGIPMVTTPIGIESIDITPGRDILLAEDATAFADHVSALLADSQQCRALADHGRETAAEKYTWQALYRTLSEVVEG